jgi:hypothetical protein
VNDTYITASMSSIIKVLKPKHLVCCACFMRYYSKFERLIYCHMLHCARQHLAEKLTVCTYMSACTSVNGVYAICFKTDVIREMGVANITGK